MKTEEAPPTSRVHELGRLGHDELVLTWFTAPGKRNFTEGRTAAQLWTNERLIDRIITIETGREVGSMRESGWGK